MISTMQRLQSENASLRLQAKVSKILYWSALGVVVAVAFMKFNGSI